MIVEAAEPAVTADLDQKVRQPGKWWQRRKNRPRPEDGDDWHLSNR
jgi:hypothetical protein